MSIRPFIRRSVRPSRVIFRPVLGASCAVYAALFKSMSMSKSGEVKPACPSWTSFSVSQYSNPIIKPDSTTCLRILCDKAVDERQLSLLCDIIPGFKRWVMASVVRYGNGSKGINGRNGSSSRGKRIQFNSFQF